MGEYHLFYQFNPYDNVWGHMTWAHAVSKDLVHWQHLPVAIPEENGIMIFSGTSVLDKNNTSGLGKDGKSTYDLPFIQVTAIRTNPSVSCLQQRQRQNLDQVQQQSNTRFARSRLSRSKVFWHEATQKVGDVMQCFPCNINCNSTVPKPIAMEFDE